MISAESSRAPVSSYVIVFAMLAMAGAGVAIASQGVRALFVALAFPALFAALALMFLVCWAFEGLLVWQRLAAMTIFGYVVLNYGFANFVLRIGGVPVPFGYLLALTVMVLALLQARVRDVGRFLREPVVLLWGVLLVLTVSHLVIDTPRYGLYALRDASFVAEGAFLLLGFLWAKDRRNRNLLVRVLPVLFLVNLVYALTYPWRDVLQANSPVSGAFQPVALLGTYRQIPLNLLTGALFYLLVARRVTAWPKWFILPIGLLQMGWLAVVQARSTYVAIVVCMISAVLFGEIRKGIKVAGVALLGLTLLFTILILLNIELGGRVGQVGPDFFAQHLSSLSLRRGTPGELSIRWRLRVVPEVWSRVSANSGTLLLGEGFGRPLTSATTDRGIPVRQPHNTHLSVLARLGAIGLLFWSLMHLSIFSLLIRNVRRAQRGTLTRDLNLWFFLYYICGMMLTTVQPWLEFSYGAIPCYTLIGFYLGRADAA